MVKGNSVHYMNTVMDIASTPDDHQAPSTSHHCNVPSATALQPPFYPNRPYGPGNFPRSPSRCQPLRNMYDHTQHWMANHHMAARPYNPSPAPSVMSTSTHMSIPDDAMSTISQQTTLTIHPDGQNPNLTELRNVSTGSSCENVNPDLVHYVNQRLSEVNVYFGRQDLLPKVIAKAFEISKHECMPLLDKDLLLSLYQKINQLLKTSAMPNQLPPGIKKTCFYCIFNLTQSVGARPVLSALLRNPPGDLVVIIGHFLGESSTCVLALDNLLAGPEDGEFCREVARKSNIMGKILQELRKKQLAPVCTQYLLHSLKQLLKGQNAITKQFADEAFPILFEIIQTYEGAKKEMTLSQAFAVLEVICVEQQEVEKFVMADGIQMICSRLHREKDQRVVREGVRLLCNVSDARASDTKDLRDCMGLLLGLTQAYRPDTFLVSKATGFLMNIIANRPHNKLHLISLNTIPYLLSFFVTYSSREKFDLKLQPHIDALLDNTICTLISLIRMEFDEPRRRQTDSELSNEKFRQSLLTHLSHGSLSLKIRVLKFIMFMITKVNGWKSGLLTVFDDHKGDNLIVVVFTLIAQCKPSRDPELNNLCHNLQIQAFKLLKLIMTECSTDVTTALCTYYRHLSLSPMDIAQMFSREGNELTLSVLEFCDKITDDQIVARNFEGQRLLLEDLENSVDPRIALLSRSIVSKLSSQEYDPIVGVFANNDFDM